MTDPTKTETDETTLRPPEVTAAATDFVTRCLTPFPPEQVGVLTRRWCSACETRQACKQHEWVHKGRCTHGTCEGGHISAVVHLDYVGHADVTARLLTLDPFWTWEPVAYDETGRPAMTKRDHVVSMWIRLTVNGITRLGVGTAQASKDDIEKELIGDAIRNAAMRFGIALNLWSKAETIDGGFDRPAETDTTTDPTRGRATELDLRKAFETAKVTATQVIARANHLRPDNQRPFKSIRVLVNEDQPLAHELIALLESGEFDNPRAEPFHPSKESLKQLVDTGEWDTDKAETDIRSAADARGIKITDLLKHFTPQSLQELAAEYETTMEALAWIDEQNSPPQSN